MPDLDTPHVITWLQRHNPSLAQNLDPFGSPDTDPDIAGALVALGTALDTAKAQAPGELAATLQSDEGRDLLRSFTSGLGPARITRLLDWLSEPDMPRREAVLTSLFGQSHAAGANKLRTALRVVNRRLLLKQIFAGERVFSLLAACQTLKLGRPS
jgi:hypothetical protein